MFKLKLPKYSQPALQTWCHKSTRVTMNLNLKLSSSITAIELVDNTDEMQTY